MPIYRNRCANVSFYHLIFAFRYVGSLSTLVFAVFRCVKFIQLFLESLISPAQWDPSPIRLKDLKATGAPPAA